MGTHAPVEETLDIPIEQPKKIPAPIIKVPEKVPVTVPRKETIKERRTYARQSRF